VEGIQQLGIITALTDAARSSHGAAAVVSLSFVAATALLSVLTGSGTAPYFSFAEVVGHLPASSGVLPVRTLTAIWGTSNLMRQASPVCAAVLIVAGAIKVSPAELVKRTAVPMTIATICNAILAMLFIQV
ncbi:MAG: transporter, partial [Cutibacterium avidum]|nr:transporter [Cutibacterium avidum]